MAHMARRWDLAKHANGDIESDTFVFREAPLPALQEGEVLVRTIYLSLDATNRVWIGTWDQYMDPVNPGEPMRGFVCGEVMESRNPGFKVGDIVAGMHTWSDYFITDGTTFSVFPALPGANLAEAFGSLAIAGPTAYVGLINVGKVQAGETVVVSAAAGAVGMMAGQIAKLKGCRTIGIAGGAEKCERLTREFGYDAAIDYRADDVSARLRELAPEGIDLLFENVGGEILDAGLAAMKNFGRVVICGLISTYNHSGEPIPGPYMFRNVIMRRLRIEGFVILDYMEEMPEIVGTLAGWMLEGKLHFRVHTVDGLENAVEALKMLYTGANQGKLLVKIGDESG